MKKRFMGPPFKRSSSENADLELGLIKQFVIFLFLKSFILDSTILEIGTSSRNSSITKFV